MRKITLINDHVTFGGGGDAVLQLERNFLLEKGYDVYTIGFGEIEKNDGKTFVVSCPKGKFLDKKEKFLSSKKLEKKITSILYQISPDLIHIHLVSRFPLAVYNSEYLDRVKVIQTLHGPNLFCATSWGGLKNSSPCELGIGLKCYSRGCTSFINTLLYWQLSKRYNKLLHSKIDVFHCPSMNIYTTANLLGFKNAIYIPLGVDETFMKRENRIKQSRPTLLYIGALAEQKGVQFLMPALNKIKKVFPEVLLIIAGRGVMRDFLEKQVKEYDLEKNVDFLGFVDHKVIKSLYLKSDIFLMPSIWQEQFGLVGPEALSCETPCVASNVGGISEWLRHGENGFLVPPKAPKAIADRTIELLKNPEKRIEMGKKGREYVINTYSCQEYESSLLNLISKMLEND